MTAEEITKLQNRCETLEAEVVTLRAGSREIVALSGTLALGASATPRDVTGAVTGLLSLRAEVYKIAGKGTDAEALGVLEAIKAKAAQTDGLIAAKAQIESDALLAELTLVIEDGIKGAKITPGERDIYEAAALAKGAGKPSKEGILYLRAKLDATGKKVSTEAVDQKRQPKEVTATGKVMAIQMGIKPEDYELFQTDRPAWEAKQAAKRPGASAR